MSKMLFFSFFTNQIITKREQIDYAIYNANRNSHFAGQMFYNNIKNTLFLNSIAHTNSDLSLGAFPQGKKWVYGEWCLGTKRSISHLWHWIRRAWTDFDVHFQRHAFPHSKFSFDKWKCPRSTQLWSQKLMSCRNMKLRGENNLIHGNQTRQQEKNIFLTIEQIFNGLN